MTNATRDTTKLNFITDQGSTRAMVRWACRAERLADLFGRASRVSAAPDAAAPAVAGPTLTGGVFGGAWAFALELERRKLRAGDVGEVGAGSGGSHTKAAAETLLGSGPPDGWAWDESAGDESRAGPSPVTEVSNRAPAGGHPVPVLAGAGSASAGTGSAAGGDVPLSLGVTAAAAPMDTGADADRLKVNEPRVDPMLSAGSAGTPASAASVPAVAEVPLPGASLAVAGLAVADLAAVRTDLVPRIWVGWSSSAVRSSSSCRAVTTVGVAPVEPSDVFVRLSKPSYYALTLTRLSLDEKPR